MVDLIVHSPSRQIPWRVIPTVERLLHAVPESLLVGLGRVVVTNASDVSSKGRRRIYRRKRTVLGYYWRRHRGSAARIEIYLDTIERRWNPVFWRFPLLADFAIGSTLYHEIGHHVNFHVRREYMDREFAADKWKNRLLKDYLRQRYWWAKWPLRILFPILKGVAWLQKRWSVRSEKTVKRAQ